MDFWTRFWHTITGWQFYKPPTPPDLPPLPWPAWSTWLQRVDQLTPAAESQAWIAATGVSSALRVDMLSPVWQGSVAGIPYELATFGGRQVEVANPYLNAHRTVWPPMPASPAIEGNPTPGWDRHWIGVDTTLQTVWEAINVRQWLGQWWADEVAEWDVVRGINRQAAPTVGSVCAAGVPMLPHLLRYQEVATGRIDHQIGIVLSDYGSDKVWPAIGTDGTIPGGIPAGAVLRLRADFPEPAGHAGVVARALKRYGAIVVDKSRTGVHRLWITPDPRWDGSKLVAALGDFDVVTLTP